MPFPDAHSARPAKRKLVRWPPVTRTPPFKALAEQAAFLPPARPYQHHPWITKPRTKQGHCFNNLSSLDQKQHHPFSNPDPDSDRAETNQNLVIQNLNIITSVYSPALIAPCSFFVIFGSSILLFNVKAISVISDFSAASFPLCGHHFFVDFTFEPLRNLPASFISRLYPSASKFSSSVLCPPYFIPSWINTGWGSSWWKIHNWIIENSTI